MKNKRLDVEKEKEKKGYLQKKKLENLISINTRLATTVKGYPLFCN
jgi:hypothetical protein